MRKDSGLVIEKMGNGWIVKPYNWNEHHAVMYALHDCRVFNSFTDLQKFLDMHYTKPETFPEYTNDF